MSDDFGLRAAALAGVILFASAPDSVVASAGSVEPAPAAAPDAAPQTAAPSEPIFGPELPGPVAPPGQESPNAYPVYQAIYASLHFKGMPTDPGKNAERDSLIRERIQELGSDVEALLEATRIDRCDFGIDHSQMSTVLFHIDEVWALDRLLRADADRLFRANDAAAAGERLIARLRLARHLGASPSLIEKRAAITAAIDTLNLLIPWARQASPEGRAAALVEVKKIYGPDPYNCRAGFSHLSSVLLPAISQRDERMGPRFSALSVPDAILMAHQYESLLTTIADNWTVFNGQKELRAIIHHIDPPSTRGPLTGIDALHVQVETLRSRLQTVLTALSAESAPAEKPPEAKSAP